MKMEFSRIIEPETDTESEDSSLDDSYQDRLEQEPPACCIIEPLTTDDESEEQEEDQGQGICRLMPLLHQDLTTATSASSSVGSSPATSSDDDSGVSSMDSGQGSSSRLMPQMFGAKGQRKRKATMEQSQSRESKVPSRQSSASIMSQDVNFDKKQIPDGSVFDSHCHLEFINRRFRRQVSLDECCSMDGEELGDKFLGCIVNYCQPQEWSWSSGLDQVSPALFTASHDTRIGLSLGVHPHFADKMTDQRWSQLELLVSGQSRKYPRLRVVALGECGLDYSPKNTVPAELQKRVFLKQLQMAMKYKLPIVLHIREAEEDGLQVLEEAGVPRDYPMHRHCFGGTVAQASHWMETYPRSKIGVTGLVTYPYAWQVCHVVHALSLDSLVLETDAPYFVPQKARKYQENCSFPGQVIHVAAKVAEIKKVSLEKVLEANLVNCRQIYGRYFERRPDKVASYHEECSTKEIETIRPRIVREKAQAQEEEDCIAMRNVILTKMRYAQEENHD